MLGDKLGRLLGEPLGTSLGVLLGDELGRADLLGTSLGVLLGDELGRAELLGALLGDELGNRHWSWHQGPISGSGSSVSGQPDSLNISSVSTVEEVFSGHVEMH